MIEILIVIAVLGLLFLYLVPFEKPKGRGGPPRGGYSAA